jgi:hypothetical protein
MGDIMSNSYFTIDSNTEEKISPAAFGYWSVRWSAEVASTNLDGEGDVRMQSFNMYMQYLSLALSSYWVYSILILNVSEDFVEEFEIGFNDCLNELNEPSGASLSQKNRKYIYVLYRKYFVTIKESFDIESGDIDFSDLVSGFIEFVEYFVLDKQKMDIMQATLMYHKVSDLVAAVFETLNQKRLEFHA